MKKKFLACCSCRSVLWFLIGLVIGAWIFSNVQPRSILALQRCENTCLTRSELLGLLGSIGVQLTPGLLPNVALETDKTIVIDHPEPRAPVHLVFIPKKDIYDVSDFSVENEGYFEDIFRLMAYVIHSEGLTQYRILSNGPGYQQVNYLHFHLLGSYEPPQE